MLDNQKRAELDQAAAELTETLPMLWWGIYNGSLEAGFDKCQSFELLQTFILSQSILGSHND